MDDLTIRKTHDDDPGFRVDIYPYLVSPEVRRELGVAISSAPDYIWFTVYDEAQLVAFAALEPGSVAQLRHAYVSPDYRDQGLYCRLLDLRIKEARTLGAKSIKTVAAPSTAAIFEKYGFSLVSERGKYKVYEKELS